MHENRLDVTKFVCDVVRPQIWLILWGMNTYTIRGGNCQNGFAALLKKGSTLKGKNLLPMGANSYHFRVDPILDGKQKLF